MIKMQHPIYSFSKSTILVLLVVSILAPRSLGSHFHDLDNQGSNDCNILSSTVKDFYGAERGLYYNPTRELFLLQNLGTDVKQCMRTRDASSEDYADVGLVSCDDTDPTQIVKISFTYGDSSMIDLPPSGKSLTIDSNSYDANRPVYQYMQIYTQAQLWYFNYASDNTTFQLINLWCGQCLAGHNDSMETAECGDLYDIDSVPKNQLWRKLPSQVKLVGHLVNKLRNKCLHADKVIPNTDFADVDLRNCDFSDHAQKVKFQAGFEYQVGQTITLSTGKVLSEVSIIETARVQQMTNFNYANQYWQPSLIINGWFQLRTSLWPDNCLSAITNGTYVNKQYCGYDTTEEDLNAKPEQFWKFVVDSDC